MFQVSSGKVLPSSPLPKCGGDDALFPCFTQMFKEHFLLLLQTNTSLLSKPWGWTHVQPLTIHMCKCTLNGWPDLKCVPPKQLCLNICIETACGKTTLYHCSHSLWLIRLALLETVRIKTNHSQNFRGLEWVHITNATCNVTIFRCPGCKESTQLLTNCIKNDCS